MDSILMSNNILEDRSIVVSRVLDAPVELAWDAWTDPVHITNWWGPHGFSTTTTEMDISPGGVWRFVMHGPDGVDYLNKVVYQEVERPLRLVYLHSGEGDTEDVQFTAVVTFENLDGRTRVTLCSLFPTTEERDRVVREYGAIEGAEQTLARLATFLEAA